MPSRTTAGPSIREAYERSIYGGKRMSKNIILLSDGTGNSAAKLQKTNVWRIYQALDLTTDEQVAQYDDGVGTSRFRPLALLGSGFGFGLKRNVRHLYAFLSRNYKEEDCKSNDKPKIFAFGFSRGAYTIRLLIGLVGSQGLVNSELPEEEFQRRVRQRWNAFYREGFHLFRRPRNYRRNELEKHRVKLEKEGTKLDKQALEKRWNELEKQRFKSHCDELERQGRHVPQFEFVGLWDTVGAYGLPFEELQGLIPLATLPDRCLSPSVKCAYHALSLDDERRTFHPILWDEGGAAESGRIQQAWFPGVHSNIGGGYPKDGLSYVSLQWMVRKAVSLHLKFLKNHLDEIDDQANAHDRIYDSRAGVGGYYRYSPRPVSTLCNDTVHGVKIDRPKVHESIFRRIRGGRVAYGPIGVPLDYELVTTPPRELKKANEGTKTVTEKSNSDPTRQSSKEGDQMHGENYLDRDKAQRAERMEAVWNIVWWRRNVYFLTVCFSLFLATFPWLSKWLSTKKFLPELPSWFTQYLGEPILTATKFLLKVIRYLVPDWVGDMWLGAFSKEPVWFLIGLVGVVGTMLIGWWLDKKIHSHASDIWHFRPESPVPNWAKAPKATFLYKLRSNHCVIWTYRQYRVIAPMVMPVILLVAFAVGLAWLWRDHRDYLEFYAIPVVVVVGVYLAGRRLLNGRQ